MFKYEPIKSWEEFVDIISSLSPNPKERWVFRGQSDAEWPLETSLDRGIKRMELQLKHKPIENTLLREFKRHFHWYSQYIPHEEDKLEWLSLMQHHGAPTRLLDWTYSAYIALYFAIQNFTIQNSNNVCAVWAINQTLCWKKFKRKLSNEDKRKIEKNDRKVINKVLGAFSDPMICPLNPLHLNTRLAIQQGTFFIPLGGSLSFEDNFKSIKDDQDYCRKIEIVCSQEFVLKAFSELQRVNISEAILFPGLDGWARSLSITMLLKHLHQKK